MHREQRSGIVVFREIHEQFGEILTEVVLVHRFTAKTAKMVKGPEKSFHQNKSLIPKVLRA